MMTGAASEEEEQQVSSQNSHTSTSCVDLIESTGRSTASGRGSLLCRLLTVDRMLLVVYAACVCVPRADLSDRNPLRCSICIVGWTALFQCYTSDLPDAPPSI